MKLAESREKPTINPDSTSFIAYMEVGEGCEQERKLPGYKGFNRKS